MHRRPLRGALPGLFSPFTGEWPYPSGFAARLTIHVVGPSDPRRRRDGVGAPRDLRPRLETLSSTAAPTQKLDKHRAATATLLMRSTRPSLDAGHHTRPSQAAQARHRASPGRP